MNNHILPDDIRRIENIEMSSKIDVIYQYIEYMRESIGFWGINRTNEIQTIIDKLGVMCEVKDDTLYIKTK